MKKRWFVVILTIGLLLCVMPLSALALSSDPITDSDGNIIGWEDLSTDLYSFDLSEEQTPVVSQEQTPVVVAPAPHAASGPAETDPVKTDPVKTDPVKDAADADSAKTAAAATTPFVEDLYADDPIPDLYADTPGSADGTGSNQAVCAIGDQTYATLTEAIAAAQDGDQSVQIDLLRSIELTEGLRFENKKLTISGGNTYTLTLKESGIYANSSDITFKDLTLTIDAHTHPYEGAGNTANLITNSSKLHLSHVEFSLTPDQSLGSGIFLEHDSDLYFEDNTYAEISGFAADEASGIYAESYSEDGHGIWVTSSSLKVTGCGWYGMTIDPINLTLDNADVYFTGNGLYGYGGALGCYGVGSYGGTLTMISSTLTATNNPGGWYGYAVYAGVLDMDAASTLYATDSGGSGVGIGNSREGESHIRGRVICTGNGKADLYGATGGFVVHAQHDDATYEGNVTIESGAYVYARNNVGLSGLLNEWILNIESGATVIVDGNSQLGFANSFDARTAIKSGANVSANNNDVGIYNYAGGGDLAWATGFFLIEGGAHVTANNNASAGIYNTVYGNFSTPADDYFTIQSGADVSADRNEGYGIYNDGGVFTIENGANVSADNNKSFGIGNSHGTFIVATGANVSTDNNNSYGIYNTKSGTFTVERDVDLQVEHNKNSGIVNNENATLTLLSGRVRYNTTSNWYGGGLRNYATATLSDDVQLYNNHAEVGGDDIENGDGATITFGATGSDWALDGYPDCYHPIDGWYDDYESTRWNAHAEDEADLHMVLTQPGTYYGPLSLKAAHGPTGSLIVHKQTTGEQLVDDCDAEFTFVLTLDDETINTVNDERYGVRFENGKATFTLKDGESKAIENLPVRMGYTITEQSKGGWLLARVDGDAEGKVPYRATAEIAFVNEKQTATGSLVVTKELAGELDADDADTVFNFMLMLDDNTITTADAEEYGVQFENGIASFSLKGGESITIANLPAGVGYTIAEVRQTGWTLQSVSGADTGVVPKNDTAEIVFTNLKNGTDIPDVPVVPTEPEEPTEPEGPETPVEPEEPTEPDAPAQDETPSEEPAQDDTTVPAQPAETPAQDTTKADTLPQTGTTGWLAVVLMSFGFGLLACGWFFTRKQRAAKH